MAHILHKYFLHFPNKLYKRERSSLHRVLKYLSKPSEIFLRFAYHIDLFLPKFIKTAPPSCVLLYYAHKLHITFSEYALYIAL